MTAEEGPTWTAGQVARHLGIAESTLRAWHRRYGVGPQGAQPGRYRRYRPSDVARLRRLRDLIDSGMLASEAARMVQADPATAGQDVAELVTAALALNTDRCRLLLDDTLVRRGVVKTWDELCRPALAAVDDRQRTDPDCVDVEHVLSWAILAALHRVPRPQVTPHAPIVLLACVADEQHTLPLEALSAALAGRRVPVRMLGAATPTSSLVHALLATRVHTLVLWAQRAATTNGEILDLARPHVARLWTAGPGWAGAPPGVPHLTDLPAAVSVLTGQS
jgi:MerR family transcriptional regulator, light-induced transcriptional regulator